jgi:hypothetical protein
MKEKGQCAHATCTCDAALLSDYCGDDCRLAAEREEAGEEQMTDCHCGHPDCGSVPIETESMLMASETLAGV